MPVGVLTNALAVVLGGIVGGAAGGRLSEKFKSSLNLVFGVCSMGMGVTSICSMVCMPAVIFSLIAGSILGLAVNLESRINFAACKMQDLMSNVNPMNRSDTDSFEQMTSILVTCIVLFCASGTGIYGAIFSGMTGDNSILVSKSILDFFSSAIFACLLGYVVCSVAVPQAFIFLVLFYCAKLIYPLTDESMIADFKACGGFIMLATGFRMAGIKKFPIADMVPSMILVMPSSYVWMRFVLPLIS